MEQHQIDKNQVCHGIVHERKACRFIANCKHPFQLYATAAIKARVQPKYSSALPTMPSSIQTKPMDALLGIAE